MKARISESSITAKLRFVMGTVVLFVLVLGAVLLTWNYRSLQHERQVGVSQAVQIAHAVASGWYARAQNKEIEESAAKMEAQKAISGMRFGAEGKDYFWVNDLNARIIFHPIKPELNGKDMSGFKDPAGKAIFVEFAAIGRSAKSGYVDYLWPKPGSEKPVAKISFVQVFEPWEWVIGTGVYVDDLWAAFVAEAMKGGLILLAGLAVVGITVRQLGRSITQPLQSATEVANRIKDGDLTRDLKVTRADEIGKLLAAMGEMQGSLRRLVGQVRVGVDTVSTASAQIAAGNQDLSSRTEQQASSLEETAATMEQLTSAVKQSAENAKQANQLAMSASQAASNGGVVVGRVVSTMEDISAASKKIADIIAVIDGIAFQTNILALNAAVEAARAGEQGRGFAVVAGEVRNLAQRSAQAAREIKSLISDSVQRVEAGSQQVNDAGVAMTEIVAQVKRVSDLISEISSTSVEQTSGISQVSEAVTQMDQVTQQNAALVEESAAAAQSLKAQADQLARAVSAFKVEQGDVQDAIA